LVRDRYSSPKEMATPIFDSLFRAGTPIDAYKSVGSNFIPNPPAPTFTLLPPTTSALGSGIHIKEEPQVSRRRRTKDSPRVIKKKAKRHSSLSGEQSITTEKSYKGTQQFSNIHTSLKVLAITTGHIILGRIEELYALVKEADHAVLPELLDKANQVGKYIKRSGIMDISICRPLWNCWSMVTTSWRSGTAQGFGPSGRFSRETSLDW
jgi:hypothetical protein